MGVKERRGEESAGRKRRLREQSLGCLWLSPWLELFLLPPLFILVLSQSTWNFLWFFKILLLQLLLEEVISSSALSREVSDLVEMVWAEALGHLECTLLKPVDRISLNDVSHLRPRSRTSIVTDLLSGLLANFVPTLILTSF